MIAMSCSSYRLSKQKVSYPLMENTITIHKVTSKPRKGKEETASYVFFNMHENENTSVRAVKKFLKENPGVLFYLEHDGNRIISFRMDGEIYRFDPNRIFTDEGIRKTLLRHGHFSKEGHDVVQGFGTFLIKTTAAYAQSGYVALHNNGPNAYSIMSYQAGGQYEADAQAIHQNEEMDIDDFYFTTDSLLFAELSNKNWNVVLQNNEEGLDDGSLSIYTGRKGIRYVNIEAEHGHKKAQLKMIDVLSGIWEESLK